MQKKTPINLKVVTRREMDQIVELWDSHLQQDTSRVKQLPKDHPLSPFLRKNMAPDPIRSVLSSVRGHFDVFGIMESPYMDLEFWDSHTGFYGTSFTKYSQECCRLHFFSGGDHHAEKLVELLTSGKSEKDAKTEFPEIVYRGYCVFRPTPSHVVGRVAIEFDPSPPDVVRKGVLLTELERDGIPYLKATQTCTANLLSARFEVKTPEFIQQDPNLGYCATASLWVTSSLMSENFGTHRYRYGAITRQAIGWGNHANSEVIHDPMSEQAGLSVSEIANGLSAIGANCLVITPTATEQPQQMFARVSHEVYSFVESGFPVLCCIENAKTGEGHVVTIVGHSLPKNLKIDNLIRASDVLRNKERQGFHRHYLLSSLVKLYYAHDDAYGPFNRMELVGGVSPVSEPGWFKSFVKGKTHNSTRSGDPAIRIALGRLRTDYLLKTSLVPVPPQIRSFGWDQLEELLLHFARYEARILEGLKQDGHKKSIFVWRSLIVSGAEFKRSVWRRDYSEALKKWYAVLHLPKYVWLYEITAIDESNPSEILTIEGERPIDGEFLFDATCPKTDVMLLSERLGGSYRHYGQPEKDFLEDQHSQDCRYECYTPEKH